MSSHRLVVGLGSRRYRVERPWGNLPSDAGRVSDVTVDSRGHVFVLLRYDPLVDVPGTPVVELDRSGVRVNAWGAELIADSHMIACSRRRPPVHRRPRCARNRHLLHARQAARWNRRAAPPARAVQSSNRCRVRPVRRNLRFRRLCEQQGAPVRTKGGSPVKSWGSLGRGAASASTRMRSGCFPTGALSSSIGRMIGCRCSPRTANFSTSGEASSSRSTSGVTPRATVRDRSGAVAEHVVS